MKHIWVIQVWSEYHKNWLPTLHVAYARDDIRSMVREYRVNDPSVKCRARKYVYDFWSRG